MNNLHFSLLFFTFVGILPSHSQEVNITSKEKYNLRFGVGYFYCPPASSNGLTIWVEGARKLSTGFDVTLKFQYSQENMTLGKDWEFLAGQKRPDVLYHFDLSFSRQIKFCNHSFEPGVGFLYEISYTWLPPLDFVNNQVILFDKFGDKMQDIGISFKLDYYYTFKNGFMLGLRTQGCYVTSMLEGVFVTPILGVRF